MSLKPIVTNDALDNRSLNIFSNSVSCNELTLAGQPVSVGTITPFTPVITFPQVAPPNTPSVISTRTTYGSIVGKIVTLSGSFIVTFPVGAPNGSVAVFTLPTEIASTLAGVGSIVLTGSTDPPGFSIIGKGIVETNQILIQLVYCNNAPSAVDIISVDCQWNASYPIS